MARKRMLDSEIWRDRKVIKLSNEAFILWIAIISMADDEGIFEYDHEAWFYEIARKETTAERIAIAMQEIIAQDMVVMYGEGYGFIPSWYKHQVLSHATRSKNKRPPASIVSQYPEYLAAWVKTFTTYRKNQEGEKETIAPEYPFQESNSTTLDDNSTIPENSGKFQNTPGSIEEVRLDKVSIVKVSNIEPPAAPSQPVKKAKVFTPPTLLEIGEYCRASGYAIDAEKFLRFYESSDPPWCDSNGKPVKNWKQKIITWAGRDRAEHKKPAFTGAMLDMREA